MCLFAYLIPTWVSSKVYNRQSLKLVRTLWGHDDHVWSIDMNRLDTLPKAQRHKKDLAVKHWADANVHIYKTRSSWLNCALRDDEAVYWVSIGHYEAVAVGN